MKKVCIINGPNLNLLGKREKEIYGDKSFEEVFNQLQEFAQSKNMDLSYFQSNEEGEIINKIHECMIDMDYIVINPGAFTHYSYSIFDAILAVKVPTIEVHISNIFSREEWRKKSVISPACVGIISGLGLDVYRLALIHISEK
ncbi:MAG: type II 3-dehydroquinate dehydratase [Actinobacteria bacterium]|nr:type II 3-dehydroquinate dehydratase [Actinomycetota bacterium]